MLKPLFVGARILPDNGGLHAHFDGRDIVLSPIVDWDDNDGTGHKPVTLAIFIDGELATSGKHQEDIEHTFSGKAGDHVLYMKHEFYVRKHEHTFHFLPEAVTFTINRRPVHHTKTDPHNKLLFALYATYAFLFICAVKLVSFFVIGLDAADNSTQAIYYGAFIAATLISERIFRRHHLWATFIASTAMVIELVLYCLPLGGMFSSLLDTSKPFDAIGLLGVYFAVAIRLLALFFTLRGVAEAVRFKNLHRHIHKELTSRS
jgi:hypothetical protein